MSDEELEILLYTEKTSKYMKFHRDVGFSNILDSQVFRKSTWLQHLLSAFESESECVENASTVRRNRTLSGIGHWVHMRRAIVHALYLCISSNERIMKLRLLVRRIGQRWGATRAPYEVSRESDAAGAAYSAERVRLDRLNWAFIPHSLSSPSAEIEHTFRARWTLTYPKMKWYHKIAFSRNGG